MTVWPMETVYTVGRLRVMGYESREVYALLHERLARSLVHAARTHAVEIDPRDTVMFEVVIPGEEEAWMRKFEARWQPQTTTVELAGGPQGGLVMDVKDAPARAFKVVSKEPHSRDPYVTTQTVIYECVGWSETHRRWVYGPTR